jgi:hypothetical protein
MRYKRSLRKRLGATTNSLHKRKCDTKEITLEKKKEVFLKKMGNDQEAMIKESSSLKKE